MKQYKVAVVGATGAVGTNMLRILEERDFPVGTLLPLASKRSEGSYLEFKGEKVMVEEARAESFEGVDIALFSAGSKISKALASEAVKRGTVVIDNSNAFRMDPKVPLVVPEVNAKDIEGHSGIIANPNCSTIQMVMALNPIRDAVGIKRVVVSTYQAVSGTGTDAIDELLTQSKKVLEGKAASPKVYPHSIAFNALPHIDVFDENGDSLEELKMVLEPKKIFHDDELAITATTVRVPVVVGHSESVNIETHRKISADEVREILAKAPGIQVMDDPKENVYPLAVVAAGKDEVFVGRIREDRSISMGINLWIVADNLRKGAALNTIQIAEHLI